MLLTRSPLKRNIFFNFFSQSWFVTVKEQKARISWQQLSMPSLLFSLQFLRLRMSPVICPYNFLSDYQISGKELLGRISNSSVAWWPQSWWHNETLLMKFPAVLSLKNLDTTHFLPRSSPPVELGGLHTIWKRHKTQLGCALPAQFRLKPRLLAQSK